jgi:hypothetical protein
MASPNRPWFWIASLIKRKASTRPALAYDVHYAVGRPARTTAGLVAAAISGTRSIREECARRASTTGLRHSAFLVPAGRHIPTGMRSHEIQSHCVSCSEARALRLSQEVGFPHLTTGASHGRCSNLRLSCRRLARRISNDTCNSFNFHALSTMHLVSNLLLTSRHRCAVTPSPLDPLRGVVHQ